MIGKDAAYALFSEGKMPNDAELKALGLKYRTRNTYYDQWILAGRPRPRVNLAAESAEAPEVKMTAKKPTKTKTNPRVVTIKGESVGPYTERSPATEANPPEIEGSTSTKPPGAEGGPEKMEAETTQGTAESEKVVGPGTAKVEVAAKDDDGRIPKYVSGSGLPIVATISLKTLGFYEIAASTQQDLTLGDFIDQCVEDFFTGRGYNLGLIREGGNNGG